MANSLNPVLRVSAVLRGVGPAKGRVPNVAVVYGTHSGELLYFDGRPLTWSQQMISPARIRYDVDIRDHRRTGELRSTPLRTIDGHYFIATVDVALRVHDPREVVQRGLHDLLPIVYKFLARSFRTVTVKYTVEQAAAAEDEIRKLFSGEVRLPEGLTIFEVEPRLEPRPVRDHGDDDLDSASEDEPSGKAPRVDGAGPFAHVTANRRGSAGGLGKGIGSSGHVFVSYHHDDRDYVLRLAGSLSGAGIVPWYDHDIEVGEPWADRIEQQVTSCAALVVVMTPAAGRSKWVKREVQLAETLNKPIFPLLRSGEAWFRLSDLHYSDVRHGHLPGADFLQRLKAVATEPPP